MLFHKSFIVASAAAFTLFPGANASVLRRNQEPSQPSCVDFTPFTYAGCFQDPPSPAPHTLLYKGDSLDTHNMTVEKCVAFCKGNDYRYAGLEYYGECTCGASVYAPSIDESSCSFACTGNSSEVCGGFNAVSIYQDPTFPAVDNTVISDYQAIGCYTEGSNGRSLAWRQDQLDASSMTTENCLTACKKGGYPIAGLEYAQECYCGVVLGNGTISAPKADCNMACKGDNAEVCGGPNRLNLYVATDLESQQPCANQGSSSSSAISSTSMAFSTSSTSSTTETKATSSLSSWSSSPASSYSPTSSYSSSPSSSASSVSSYSFYSSASSSSSSSPVSSSCSSTSPTSPSSSSSSGPPAASSTPSSSASPVSSFSSSLTSLPVSTLQSTSSKPTTFPTSSTTSTTKASLCTSYTTTTPTSTCEYKCGSWCSNPIPNWSDQIGCVKAQANCAVQIASCFLQAGFPDSLGCTKFATWCSNVNSYCSNYCPGGSCSKPSWFSKFPPNGPQPSPTVSTSVYTCSLTNSKPSSTLVPPSSTSTCIPLPTQTNICLQPDNPSKGYGSTFPVGNIPLPCLTCNNILNDYKSGNQFKLYTSPQSSDCPSYSRGGPSGPIQACKDACDSQYNTCLGTYANGCANRSGPQYTDSYSVASTKCFNQRLDCYLKNSNVSPSSSRCGSWNSGWY